jgi:hypothetical protein
MQTLARKRVVQHTDHHNRFSRFRGAPSQHNKKGKATDVAYVAPLWVLSLAEMYFAMSGEPMYIINCMNVGCQGLWVSDL